MLPSQSGFCVLSMHFTATPRIPPASNILKPPSFNSNSMVEPQTFTAALKGRLPTLYTPKTRLTLRPSVFPPPLSRS